MIFDRSTAVNRIILLCGCGRSGTTILGKLIGSMENVEYFFEPAFLHKFIYSLDDIPAEQWKQIFSWYAYDDLLLGAVAGRNLNWNENDDSCVLKFKSDDVKQRLTKTHRKLELDAISQTHRLALKIPDLLFRVPAIRSLFPGIKSIAMHRNAEENILSIHRKQWFSNENLRPQSPMPQIAFRVVENFRVPRWVHDNEIDFWRTCSEVDRAGFYYAKSNEFLFENREHFFVLHYNKWIENATSFTENICSHLGTVAGEKTADLVASIVPQSTESGTILHELSAPVLEQVEQVSSKFSTLFPA